MAFVMTKRPVDVIDHTMDFTSYIPEGYHIASATTLVRGEGDNVLTVISTVIDGPLVTVRLSGGTPEMIYQVYIDATMEADA